jgi:hypothetical protein
MTEQSLHVGYPVYLMRDHRQDDVVNLTDCRRNTGTIIHIHENTAWVIWDESEPWDGDLIYLSDLGLAS